MISFGGHENELGLYKMDETQNNQDTVNGIKFYQILCRLKWYVYVCIYIPIIVTAKVTTYIIKRKHPMLSI